MTWRPQLNMYAFQLDFISTAHCYALTIPLKENEYCILVSYILRRKCLSLSGVCSKTEALSESDCSLYRMAEFSYSMSSVIIHSWVYIHSCIVIFPCFNIHVYFLGDCQLTVGQCYSFVRRKAVAFSRT